MRSKNSIKVASHPKCNLMLIAVPAPMIGTPGSSRKLVNLLEGGSGLSVLATCADFRAYSGDSGCDVCLEGAGRLSRGRGRIVAAWGGFGGTMG